MASFEFLAIIVSVLGLAASITYYAIILNNANKTQQQQLETRQANLFNSLYNAFLDEKMFDIIWELHLGYEYEDYDDFMAKYGPETDYEAFKKFHRFFAHLEGMGIYIKQGLISAELIDDFMSSDICTLWEKFEKYFKESRIVNNDPLFFEHVEYLYNQIKPIREKHIKELKQ